MANNVRRLRVAFLLTPKQLAARIGADASDVERMEAEDFELSEEWIKAVADALGVPRNAVTDPAVDIDAVRIAASDNKSLRHDLCPIGARFAILAIVAKLGGLKLAKRLDEDDLARAVRNFIGFVEADGGADEDERLTRQKLALRIAVLAILQSRAVVPGPRFEDDLEEALAGGTAMIRSFSRIEPAM